MNIGDNIKKFRKEKGMTQKELAIKLNKSERMIQKYENNDVEPSIDILTQISNILETSLMDLIDNDSTYIRSTPDGMFLKNRIRLNSELMNEILLQLIADDEIKDMLLLDGDLEFFTKEIKGSIISLVEFTSSKNRQYIFHPLSEMLSNESNESDD